MPNAFRLHKHAPRVLVRLEWLLEWASPRFGPDQSKWRCHNCGNVTKWEKSSRKPEKGNGNFESRCCVSSWEHLRESHYDEFAFEWRRQKSGEPGGEVARANIKLWNDIKDDVNNCDRQKGFPRPDDNSQKGFSIIIKLNILARWVMLIYSALPEQRVRWS